MYVLLVLCSRDLGGVCEQPCTTDPCDKPSYCEDGDMTGDEDDCFSYLSCLYGEWTSLPCGAGLAFDMNNCGCNFIDQALCAICNNNSTDATILPGGSIYYFF